MTFFGGNVIQAPNPIDFDLVFIGFTRLDETGNISVLVTVASIFILYFVVLVYARRADKRDENKVIAFVIVPLCMFILTTNKLDSGLSSGALMLQNSARVFDALFSNPIYIFLILTYARKKTFVRGLKPDIALVHIL